MNTACDSSYSVIPEWAEPGAPKIFMVTEVSPILFRHFGRLRLALNAFYL